MDPGTAGVSIRCGFRLQMEGIPELLKNMLLVMNGMSLFYEDDSPKTPTQLCRLTCDRLDTFVPTLKRELFHIGLFYHSFPQ